MEDKLLVLFLILKKHKSITHSVTHILLKSHMTKTHYHSEIHIHLHILIVFHHLCIPVVIVSGFIKKLLHISPYRSPDTITVV